MKYRAVLFDLDGTLIDSVPMIVKVTRQALQSMGLHFDDVAIRHSIGIPLAVQAHRFARGREQEFTAIYRGIYVRNLADEARLFPGTLDMLAKLRTDGYLTGVVTSKLARGATRAIDSAGMTELFDCVVTADDVANYKPHPEPLMNALGQLGVSADRSLYVGDSAFDIEMARQAGVSVAAVTWGARTREELEPIRPDAVVDDWQGLLGLLESLLG